MIRPDAVLFDCDGVIVDSEGPTYDLLIEELSAHGLPMTRQRLEEEFIGTTVETISAKARAAGARLPKTWVGDFYRRMYVMLAGGVPLVEGAAEVLDRLDREGIPYAMGSNGSLEKMQITLGQHALIHRFRAVLSAQAIGKPKPAPDVYVMAAAACGAAPGRCVVVEDSASGARAALAAGIPCLGFAAHGSQAPAARQLAALQVPLFHSLADLPGLLGL
jgi:HAD superfamily hydrolase (TIGR01509 family)